LSTNSDEFGQSYSRHGIFGSSICSYAVRSAFLATATYTLLVKTGQ